MSQRQVARQENSSALIEIGSFVGGFVQRHYIVSSLYILGVFLVAFGTGFAVSSTAAGLYETTMDKVDVATASQLSKELWHARQAYQQSAGFFSCDATCQRFKKVVEEKERELEAVKKSNNEIMSQAKAHVGVFSEYGIQEVRDLFWSKFAGGKDFAKRASMWDLLFLGIGAMGRDEGLAEYLIRWFMNVLMNLTLGLIGALIGFVWSVWSVITSYQTDLPTTLFAFIVFAVAGASMTMTVLLGIYGVLASGVYAAVRSSRASIEGGGGGFNARPRFIRDHSSAASSSTPSFSSSSSSSSPFSSSTSSSSSQAFSMGSSVRIFGLASVHYNGEVGTVVGFDGERYRVALRSGNTLAIREANLVAA